MRGLQALSGALLLSALMLAGCATRPAAPEVAAPAAAASAADDGENEAYRLDITVDEDPGGTLATLLHQHLDLARYRASAAALNRSELARLIAATPAQAQALLETEGFFNAEVQARRAEGSDGGETRVLVNVKAGPRTKVGTLKLEFEQGLAADDAAALRDSLRRAWPLPVGAAFTQSQWAAGKNDLLVRARTGGFPLARWGDTAAQVDPDTHEAQLQLVMDSGARARLGELRIEGLDKQSRQTVERLSGYDPGDPYTELRLAEFQERLAKTQLFDAVRVQLLSDSVDADGRSPVLVTLREAQLQQATVALGYNANTGQHISVEHLHRRPFGLPLRARSKLELGRDVRGAEFEISSHPQPDLHRSLASMQYEQDRSGGQDDTNLGLRLGRLYESTQDERLSYVELLRSRETIASTVSTSHAVSINQQWIRRRLDSTLLPTDGHQGLALVGLGMADASDARRGVFGRLQLKLGAYRPLSLHWYGSARLEVAQVVTSDRVGVPEKLLLRAGGDDSVRGYGYNTLGPQRNGVTVGGRVLGTGSLEIARPFSMSMPSLWGALFVDAGNAASRWQDYSPVIGWGAGVRWRSPVGPLRVDLARAQETGRWRLHFSVGIAL
ncbi:MAG: outer membrane protein assembly factor [Roseateles depolymerans]|uniref:Outer membrane protein assembly factor n=1 Tax=Roseateles depolymerans TaxID=76731 RepID=A0A2W5FQ43_9BURK|nr:MAG: outer membrane protein assembly factor [Roseateles depolymerans]